MSLNPISVPQILINDDVWAIVPGTFVYDGGEIETTVRSVSTGNGQVVSVHTQNAEGAISKCSFDVVLDNGLDSRIATLKSNIGGNTIKAVQSNPNGDNFVRTFPGMSLGPRIDRNASADGVTSLEFSGDPMVIG
ncbi:MAG: hypothetical protein GY820_17195 [Gammaproteobacteria bacterium]|nr:hypothetical protein [Gammaproteobacteria bacterium]